MGVLNKYRNLLAVLTIAIYLFVNSIERGPFNQSTSENALVFHNRCTEFVYGWPVPFHHRYPEGFVHPDEWLPWEVDPVYQSWSAIGIISDTITLILLIIVIRFFGGSIEKTQ